jgi:hypothetical protein
MNLLEFYEADYALIESWLDEVFPRACADARLPILSASPPRHVTAVSRDERWWRVQQGAGAEALLLVYANMTRCNVVLIADASVDDAFLSDKMDATTVGAKQIGWRFHLVDSHRLVCFFEDMDLAASGGRNGGWIARDLARMLRWLLSEDTAF